MRTLLDTNILIHREAATTVRDDIGTMFYWLDKLHYEKFIHPASVDEIRKHKDPRVRRTFETKLKSYHQMEILSAMPPEVAAVGTRDATQNDRIDTLLVNELYADRVDILISEDRAVRDKAVALGIGDRVFTIEAFLEKVLAENPDLADYKVLAVRKARFGEVEIRDGFFDTFRSDYGGQAFDRWFRRKADEHAYVCFKGADLAAFLYLKVEDANENYADISPVFRPKRRLKIGTFKVDLSGYRLGERLLKIIFDNAVRQRAEEVYVTIFPNSIERVRLIGLLQDFGFQRWGIKANSFGDEEVYVRRMTPSFRPDDAKLTFPFVSRSSRAFLVPIYPAYHTSLLPDSILRTESPDDFIEQEPHRNSIRKVYVSRSVFRDLQRGDNIVFYRTGVYYKGVATTLGIVDGVYRRIQDEDQFVRLCRKRSVFTDRELRQHWNYRRNDRPFIVGFLYAYSFPKRPNLKELIDNGIIRDIESVPRGFERITAGRFSKILELAQADPRIVVD